MTIYSNIHNRFGPPWDGKLNRRAHGFTDFYRAFVAQFFGVDDGYPKTASLRAARSHEGATRIVPLSYLDTVTLPGDYPRWSGDPNVTDEVELQALYESHFPLDDLDVRLPAIGAPIVSDAVNNQGFARRPLSLGGSAGDRFRRNRRSHSLPVRFPMPFDLDCNDSDFRAHLSEEQLARLERRQAAACHATPPPTSLAAVAGRLSSGAGAMPRPPPCSTTGPRPNARSSTCPSA